MGKEGRIEKYAIFFTNVGIKEKHGSLVKNGSYE